MDNIVTLVKLKSGYANQSIMPPRVGKTLSYKVKEEIIAEIEKGRKKADLARQHQVNVSRIRTVWKNRDQVKAVLGDNTQDGQSIAKLINNKQAVVKIEKLVIKHLERNARVNVPTNAQHSHNRLVIRGFVISAVHTRCQCSNTAWTIFYENLEKKPHCLNAQGQIDKTTHTNQLY